MAKMCPCQQCLEERQGLEKLAQKPGQEGRIAQRLLKAFTGEGLHDPGKVRERVADLYPQAPRGGGMTPAFSEDQAALDAEKDAWYEQEMAYLTRQGLQAAYDIP